MNDHEVRNSQNHRSDGRTNSNDWYGSHETYASEDYDRRFDANGIPDRYDDDLGSFGVAPEDDSYDGFGGGENEGGPDPRTLVNLLERAIAQQDEIPVAASSTATSPEDVQRARREHLEQTWKDIRTHWLWAHETHRSVGAETRGEEDMAPLHLVCKLTNDPPTDIFREIVESAPSVAGWEDAHGFLPIHHACIHGASYEVLKLLTDVHPRSTAALDAQNRTPLHLYATRGTQDPYNSLTLAANFRILCQQATSSDTGVVVAPAEVRDKTGMVPMHYACAYGTTPSVLGVLEEAFPRSLEARDDNGRTPLHFVMVNAQRATSPDVLGFLLGLSDGGDREDEAATAAGPPRLPLRSGRAASVDLRDREGNLPLHLLNLGIAGADFERHPDKLRSVAECLGLYLEAEPRVSTDFLAALQALPDPLQDVAVVSPHVRNMLNAKIIQRFPTSILMLDGIMLVTMIVCFELATTRFVDQSVVVSHPENHLSSPLVMLYVTALYFFLRELIQVIASLTLGTFSSWLYDTTNWLDVLVIGLVTYYTTAMTPMETAFMAPIQVDDFEAFRTGTALTKGVLWTAVIFFLKSTQVDFAVFLNGVFYVVQRLVAFLLAILVILISFAQMFWMVYLEQPVCKFSCREGDTQCETEMEGCSYPHCEFGDSFLKVYTMMMGEIGTETRYDQNLVAQILYIFYGFFIVILLSNVLIAIVTDSYEIVQNDRAAIVFWSNRLDFVAEMDSIASVVRKRVFCNSDDAKDKNLISNGSTEDDLSFVSGSFSNNDYNAFATEELFRGKWNSIMSTFEQDVYGAASEDIRPMDFWYDVLNKTLAILVIPPWLIIGFVTVGILWPPQVREWLFVQTDTAASRAEIERRKLEQLLEIQQKTKLLKEELRMEMQHDRVELFRMKAEVDAVQDEVLSDLKHVNELVSTLLMDLGRTPATQIEG